ncbi:hypothetical protein A3A84_01090 [Candidatus Collierbacteria bacterium RIFCSPLOWO2_01_FULL_50_23]|uniref:CMP/dCMP-type deaminase domain-containing protein n=2 Tax=Candidatus Collieribacteriota TaxID=1752725 RepID=A0A1F5EQS8_9BACT|nr:MAG: hypothetical protein A3D09_01840 [Candidatus Collierbacteria bacterium RIFCSPHIGHO2_02_FULL_49_10]OGD71381.1 MAG: hypothetical protein A2703_03635 [Candidatus Collierbacteria bacterium RIFCSPHIGHO2_01_FULL_50_25]OGD74048.1 MAG: hypothetical protein A3A84_01090 [Candidatus Collierbacteria bacterium RIFCSPLOWO2_01_FULL_50_23]
MPILLELADRLREARVFSYAPVTDYHVGASILAVSGRICDGANIEIVTLSETGHAEEMAAKSLVMAGEIQLSGRRFIKAVAVCSEGKTAPCGRCRQILEEFCDNCLVIKVDLEENILRISSLERLLPDAFGPSTLGID